MYSIQIEKPIPKMNLSLYDWSSFDPGSDYIAYINVGENYFDWKDEFVPKPLSVNRWHINA